MADADHMHVVTLVGAGTSLFDLAVAFEVFGRRPPIDRPWYRFTVTTETPGAARLDLGLSLTIERALSSFRTADTIMVAGWPETAQASPALVSALRSAHRRRVRIVSFCSGTLFAGVCCPSTGATAGATGDREGRCRGASLSVAGRRPVSALGAAGPPSLTSGGWSRHNGGMATAPDPTTKSGDAPVGQALADWVPVVVQRIFDRCGARRVIVFGSVVRGDARSTPASMCSWCSSTSPTVTTMRFAS